MKLSERIMARIDKHVDDPRDTVILAEIESWANEVRRLEAALAIAEIRGTVLANRLEGISCGECAQNMLECECERWTTDALDMYLKHFLGGER